MLDRSSSQALKSPACLVAKIKGKQGLFNCRLGYLAELSFTTVSHESIGQDAVFCVVFSASKWLVR
jgi:hypothetical protein